MNDRAAHLDLLDQVADSTAERDEVRRILGEKLTEADLDAHEQWLRAPFAVGRCTHAHRMSAPAPSPFPIERWAARAPRTRWPLVLLLIVLLIGVAGGLAGCGGGDAEDDGGATTQPINCHDRPELCQ